MVCASVIECEMEIEKEFQRLAKWQVVVLILLSTVAVVRSDGSDHKYKAKDQVPLYVNKVGPFQNPR